MKTEELEIIAKMVISLTKIKQKEVPHLCVENFAQQCFGQLLSEHRLITEEGRYRLDGGSLRLLDESINT